MSLRRLFRRRPYVPFNEWGWEVRQFRLRREGVVEYAQWLHPFETAKSPSQDEVDGLRQFIAPGDFVIDVGAHTGDTALPMALAAGPAGCVLALEPNPHVYRVLAKNAELNADETRIIPRCYAATRDDGQFTFNYSDASFCNGGMSARRAWQIFSRKHPLAVQGRNLLRVLHEEFADQLPRLAYVKVDAEGFDREVLETILPVLQAYRPTIRTEVFRKLTGRERRGLFALLADAGYRVHRHAGGAEPAGRELSADDMTAEKHFDLLAVHRQRPPSLVAA